MPVTRQGREAAEQRRVENKVAAYVRILQAQDATQSVIAHKVFQKFGYLVKRVNDRQIVLNGKGGSDWVIKLKEKNMPAKKKTTRRKSSKAPSPAQLRARKAFALAAKARSKASKKKAGKKPVRRNKTIITKPKKVVVINPARYRVLDGDLIVSTGSSPSAVLSSARRKYAGTGASPRFTVQRFDQSSRKWATVSTSNPAAKSTRRKYRNGYLDLVIMGHAKKTPSGWSLGGKTFKQGKGIVPASKRGYYLDRATGTVFSKKARNPKEFYGNVFGFHKTEKRWHKMPIIQYWPSKQSAITAAKKIIGSKAKQYSKFQALPIGHSPSPKRNADHRDSEHPIEVTKHFRSGPPGYMTPWQRAHSQGQQGLFDHGIKAAKKRNAKKNPAIKAGDSVKDQYGKWHVVHRVSGNSVFVSGGTIHKTKIAAVKKAKKNPSVKTIRKEFAGTLGKATDAFAPIGTPRNVAKLGKLLLIDTENATIKPTGIVYLCADSKGKLHLCGSKNVPIYSGAAQSFGRVKKLEYETAKPHLYPGQGTIQFWHKMGEESGNQPTLYADGKGGLKFRGGSYKITREGIVD